MTEILKELSNILGINLKDFHDGPLPRRAIQNPFIVHCSPSTVNVFFEIKSIGMRF